ncbi:PAS domain S-box protein [Sphingosinicella sp.]|uniref:PAS domain S-box protein n=1 Tax=Sphingosinicella sp. TaxID=1917971 RepID=UPI0040381A47
MESVPPATNPAPSFAGMTGAAARDHDWAKTPLGPRAQWPQSLKTAASIVLHSNIPMLIGWGPDLIVIHNDSYGEILGDRRPALGKPLRNVWADIWDVVGDNAARVMAGETVFMESAPRPLRRDGEVHTAWITSCYNPIRGEDGEIAGIFGVVTAVSGDEQAALRLRESEERFRLIADSAPVPMWVTRLDRTRSFVNRAYVDFLGITYEEAVTYDWRDIIHPEDAPRILAESLAGEASLERFVLEGRFRRGDGGWRWLRSISQPRWGPGGEHIGFIGVAYDISEWKEAEETLREINDRLERAVAARTADLQAALDRVQAEMGERERAEEALRQAQKMEAVGRLTGGIAHDFNNLLTPVIGGLEMIVGALDDDRLKRLAEGALDSSRRGAKLTTQLLAFSRIQQLRMAPVAVDAVIANLGQILSHSIGAGIEIRMALAAGAPALCDENQLENAILNLAINARDAMPDGGVLAISTDLTCEPACPDLPEGDYVRISVADTGSGMPPEVASRAIEPFFTTKPFGQGTGLGLAQVYGIARQAGGTLRIESDEATGTTVHVILPQAGQAAADEERAAPGGPTPRMPAARILIVDDDPDVRAFLAGAVTDLGHAVREAVDGPAALAALDDGAPDLMLVDFAMPGMNGAEVARAARRKFPALPIIFVTGFAQSDQLDAGFADVPLLKKPFGIAALANAIRAALPAIQGS